MIPISNLFLLAEFLLSRPNWSRASIGNTAGQRQPIKLTRPPSAPQKTIENTAEAFDHLTPRPSRQNDDLGFKKFRS